MPILIVEHSGKRKRATLNGAASIGRTPNNDVVIEHPAVSRTHAIIERDGDTYFIADNQSKTAPSSPTSTSRKNNCSKMVIGLK